MKFIHPACPMSETIQKIDLDVVRSEFGGLFKAWKKTWVPIGHLGTTTPPNRIPRRMLPHYTEANITAEKPSEEAYAKMIEYLITLLRIAVEMGYNIRVIMKIIVTSLDFSGGHEVHKTEFFTDVLIEFAQYSKPIERVSRDTTSIEGLMAEVKKQFGAVFTFGLKDIETETSG